MFVFDLFFNDLHPNTYWHDEYLFGYHSRHLQQMGCHYHWNGLLFVLNALANILCNWLCRVVWLLFVKLVPFLCMFLFCLMCFFRMIFFGIFFLTLRKSRLNFGTKKIINSIIVEWKHTSFKWGRHFYQFDSINSAF